VYLYEFLLGKYLQAELGACKIDECLGLIEIAKQLSNVDEATANNSA